MEKAYKFQENLNIHLSPRYDSMRNAGLPITSKKAIVFFDANNWYHNLKKFFNPNEVDIVKISEIKKARNKNYNPLKIFQVFLANLF